MNNKKLLLYTVRGGAPTPPPPVDGHRVLYLENGDSDSLSPFWCIDTGINWKYPFLNSSILGLENPGIEMTVTYSYRYTPPEGNFVAGYWGGEGNYFRLFGYPERPFCFDCPSDGNTRVSLNNTMSSNTTYTATVRREHSSAALDDVSIEVYLGETRIGGQSGKTSRMVDGDAKNIYLWMPSTDYSWMCASGGVKIYGCTIYYLETGVRHTKVYEGVPWVDLNDVACVKDLVSGQLQYNSATNPQPFLYAEIQ